MLDYISVMLSVMLQFLHNAIFLCKTDYCMLLGIFFTKTRFDLQTQAFCTF